MICLCQEKGLFLKHIFQPCNVPNACFRLPAAIGGSLDWEYPPSRDSCATCQGHCWAKLISETNEATYRTAFVVADMIAKPVLRIAVGIVWGTKPSRKLSTKDMKQERSRRIVHSSRSYISAQDLSTFGICSGVASVRRVS